VLCTGTLLAAWEASWRLNGHAPSVHAVDESWLLAFDRIGPDSTVVLGTSRIQAALDPASWAAQTGTAAPVLLALPGNSPLPLLERLARDATFHGLVLIDLLPMYVFDATDTNEVRGARLLEEYDAAKKNPSRWTEAWLAVHVGGSLVLRDPRLQPLELVKQVRLGQWPDPTGATMRADRFAPVDFTSLRRERPWSPVEGFKGWEYETASTVGTPADEARVAELLVRLEEPIARLQARGVRVVAVYLPACGKRAEIEERRWPRARYWDRFAASTSARAVHLGDVEGFPRFDCYDGSHIDVSDSPAFTRALIELVGR
jgi:hypothetical protein